MRSRFLAALRSLPALTRNPNSRLARRFIRKNAAAVIAATPKKKRPRRRDSVRMLTLARRPGADANVPYLRMSGRWLEQCGFGVGTRVYVTVEQGKLILTNDDPAGVAAIPR